MYFPRPLKVPSKILAIRSSFKAMACTGCDDSLDVFIWLKAVDELDDEKLLKCHEEFEYYKKKLKHGLDTQSFNKFCARLALISRPE